MKHHGQPGTSMNKLVSLGYEWPLSVSCRAHSWPSEASRIASDQKVGIGLLAVHNVPPHNSVCVQPVSVFQKCLQVLLGKFVVVGHPQKSEGFPSCIPPSTHSLTSVQRFPSNCLCVKGGGSREHLRPTGGLRWGVEIFIENDGTSLQRPLFS